MPLYLSDYKPVQWSENMPITADRMNNLETGVDQNRDSIIELASRTDTMATQAWTEDFFRRETAAASQAADQGAQAWTQIVAATTPNYANLNARFAMAELLITRLREALGQLTNTETGEKTDIYSSSNTVATTFINVNNSIKAINDAIAASLGRDPNTGVPNTQLSQHMQQIDDAISELKASYASFADSTGVDESGQAIPMATRIQQLVDVYAEVMAAHREVEEGASPDTLKLRFEAIEAALGSLTSNVNDNYVRKNDVRDNFTSSDTNLPLSAAKGKELREMIGGSFTNANTVAGAIATAQSTAQTNAEGYADQHKVDKTNIYNDLDYVPAQDATDDKVLDARQGKALKDLIDGMDTAYKAADTALDGRLTTAESAIATLNGNASTEGSVLNIVNTRIADVVAEAPEAFDTLKEIADWIGTHSTSALEMQQDIADNADAIEALQGTITNAETGLAATKAIADSALAQANTNTTAIGDNNSGLTKRVYDLEQQPKSATEIVAELPQTGDATKDYLVGPNEDGKYFYYKWINNTWNLISSGGSGEGNTSGMDLTEEEYTRLESYNENTDYYVSRADGIHHYRYVPNTTSGEGLMEVEIGIAENYNIGIDTVTETENNEEVDNTYLYLYKFAPDESSEITDETALPLVGRGTLVRKVKLPATGGGMGAYEQIRIQPAAGQSAVFTAVEGDTTPITLNLQGQKRDQDGYVATTLVITMQYRERSSDAWRTYAPGEKEVSVTSSGPSNFSTIDISPLLVLNKTIEIRVTAADKNNANLTNSSVTFSVTKVELNLTSTFNQSAPYTTNVIAFNYSYTGSGLDKTLYLYLDDTLLTTRALGTSIGNGSYNIDMSEKAAGTYNLKAYFTTNDGNSSNTLNYSIMYIPSSETIDHPIVGISIAEASITEGDVLTVNYSAYTQNADQTQEILFEIFEEGSQTAYTSKRATNVNNNQPSSILFLDYPIPPTGVESISITIRATASNANQTPYSTEQTITVARYGDTSINFDPIETNLIYEFDPVAHTNNDINREEFTYSPHSGTSYTTTLENFNWVSNGYLGDEALTFNGDAVMQIDVPVLITNVAGTDANDTPTSNGRTIEFEYEVSSVTDINAPIITYFNNSNVTEDTETSTKTGVGFEITPQNCYLISEAKSVVTDKKGFIHNEDDIAAAYLSEGSRLRVSFVIEAVGTHKTGAGNNAQTVNIYVNGQYANSCPYDGASELFTIPADANCKITIGNDSSILKLYDIRIYNRGLSEAEILQNYVTSPLLRRDKLARIRENDLLTADQTEIDYYKARQHYNCLLITGNLSPAKSEKVSCGLIFTQPNGEGGFDEKFRCMDTFPDGSYTSQNAVQGTSSVKFPVKNYKVYLTSGYELDEENKPKAVKYKYALEPGRVKESTFCWKGDYMSSDHANTFNANWADALETRIDGANHVQNSVYGFRCLLFYRPDAEESTPIVLLGDGTLNNDKGNTKTFQLEDSSDVKDSNDTRSQKWEFKNNTETPCLFQSDNLISIVDGEENYTAATDAFESTYPDEGDLDKIKVRPNYNHLQILLSWVLRRANYWDETDESARAAKKTIFKNEFARHFNMDHMLLYYLFCEFTAMTDNRAKNMFIRCDNVRDEEIKNMSGTTLFSGNAIPDNTSDWYKYLTGTDVYKAAHYTDIDWENSTFGVWTPILYDLDSCYGVENSGYLQVPYYANWNYRDVADTKYLFNGYGSILWLMFEDSFADEIRTMAQTIYTNGANGEPGLNYNSFYKYHITDNALKFPPVIINQDMNKKYLNPWINGLPDPEDSTRMLYNAQYKYLQRGSRTDQKVGFIERRSRMLYSKYLTSQFIANEASVNFRCGNAGANDPIVLTAGTACYPAIQFSDTNAQVTTTAQQYANTGDSVSFAPGPGGMGFSDTVYIRGASMLTGITGIGGYMPYEINLSGGRNLKQLILGSPTIVNTQVSSSALAGLDACSILEDLNIENFNGSSFTTLNLASNRLLKNLYATGANNLGTCSFANGGIIENIELGTGLTNLTLRNQTRIETLKFGGSDTILADNISKINTIFVEGVSNAAMETVQDIFKLRLFALKNQLDNGRAAGEAVALGGGVRISGLNMTITCRDSNNNTLPESNLLDLLINEDAMRGKGLTYDGTLSSTAYPYLSGSLTINRGQDKKIAVLRSMYPNLTIIENNSIVSCVVNYYHSGYMSDDGYVAPVKIETLYVDSGTGIIPDIYMGVPESSLPTREPTIAQTFIFGAYNEEGYIRYSGWTLGTDSSATPLSDTYSSSRPFQPTAGVQEISLYTFFNAQEHVYTVKWMMDGQEIKSVSNQKYGGGYTLKAPTVLDIRALGIDTAKAIENSNGTYTYQIFDGWEKLPTNIRPTKAEAKTSTYIINAKWSEPETRSIEDSDAESFFADTTELTSKQLFVLSRLNQTTINAHENTSNIIATRKFNYQMGYNGMQDGGIELINNNNITRKIASSDVTEFTTVHPFASNKGFTLVIDYQFGESSSTALPEVLVGCYDKDSTSGSICSFALYNGHNESNGGNGVYVCYGVTPFSNDSTKRRAVGDATHRNIIVLRREKDSPILRIYTSADATATNSLNTSISESNYIELATQNISENATICVGALRADLLTNSTFSNEANNTRNALGTVYWMKYWDEDLGLGECLQLASWPHEQMTAVITAVNTANNRPKLYFTNLNCPKHGVVTNSTFTTPNANDRGPYQTGWGSSNTKKICDNRIVQGLPVDLQAIIGKPEVGYFDYVAIYNEGASVNLSSLYSLPVYTYVPSVSSLSLEQQYIGTDAKQYGLESIYELTGKNDSPTSDITPYTWMRTPSTAINAMQYVGTGSENHWPTIDPQAYWFNIRFNEKPISWSASNKMNIYVIDSTTLSSATFYSAIGGDRIKSGDIVIYKTPVGDSTEVLGVYMFVTREEQSRLGIQTLPAEGYLSTTVSGSSQGGWIKSTPYVTRSVTQGTQRQPNYIYIDEQGAIRSPSSSNEQAAAGSLGLDFAFTI